MGTTQPSPRGRRRARLPATFVLAHQLLRHSDIRTTRGYLSAPAWSVLLRGCGKSRKCCTARCRLAARFTITGVMSSCAFNPAPLREAELDQSLDRRCVAELGHRVPRTPARWLRNEDLRSERFRQRQPRWRKLPSGSVTVPSAPFPVIDREDALFVRQRASVYGEKEGHPSGGALVAARYTESRVRSSAAANPLDVRPGREGLEPGSRAPQAVFETVQEPFERV